MPVIRAHAETDSEFDVRVGLGDPPPVFLTRKADQATLEVGAIHEGATGGIGVRFNGGVYALSPNALREIALGIELYRNTKGLVAALNVNYEKETDHGR